MRSSAPFKCDYGEIHATYDIDTDSLETLSRDFPIFIGRDDHGSRCYDHLSLFAVLTDEDAMERLIQRFGDDILSFRNTDNGNVLHEIVMNPNQNCYTILVSHLKDGDLLELANMEDRYKKKPIAYNKNFGIFNHLKYYTDFTPQLLLECQENSQEVCEFVLRELIQAGTLS